MGTSGNIAIIALAIAIPLSICCAGVFGPEAALFPDLFHQRAPGRHHPAPPQRGAFR